MIYSGRCSSPLIIPGRCPSLQLLLSLGLTSRHLRNPCVPYWALARVFGGDAMFWYRLECALGRFSVVGTTVRQGELPAHLLVDEHHQTLDGKKVSIAITVGAG